MKKKSSRYFILLLLVLLFAAPGITAYLFYSNPSWLQVSRTNKGTLLSPPLVIKSLDNQPKWRIVYWSPDTCDKACLQQLDTLARVRLALGRKLYEVDQWLVLGGQATTLDKKSDALVKQMDFRIAYDDTEQSGLKNKPTVFIANPDNYLILSYPADVNPDYVYKDLKLLLNTTQKKSD